jgi:hypothetical protein
MDFGVLLKTTWDRFIGEIVRLVLFTLVGAVLCITIVLIPTVSAGWLRGILGYVREDRIPEFEELWNFDDYLQTLLLLVVGGVLVSIGYMLLIIPGVILNVWWFYSLFFVVDKQMRFDDAMRASKNAVSGTGFFNHFVVVLIIAVLGTLGGAFSGLGMLLTTPFSLILMTLAYVEIAGAEVEEEPEAYS